MGRKHTEHPRPLLSTKTVEKSVNLLRKNLLSKYPERTFIALTENCQITFHLFSYSYTTTQGIPDRPPDFLKRFAGVRDCG